MFFAEEMSKDEMGDAWKEEQVVFGVNLFRMGPARSFMVLGYFLGYMWLIGALYMFSSIPSRKILGRLCICKYILWWCLHRWVLVWHEGTGGTLFYWAIGTSLLLGNWRRNKRRMEAKRLGREMGEPSWGWQCWEHATMCFRRDDEKRIVDESG